MDELFSYLEENEIEEVGILDPLEGSEYNQLKGYGSQWVKQSHPTNPRTLWFVGSVAEQLRIPLLKSRFVPMSPEKLLAWAQMGPFPALLLRRETGPLESRPIAWVREGAYSAYGKMIKQSQEFGPWDLYVWTPTRPWRRALLICHHCGVLPDIRRQLLVQGIRGEFVWLSDGKGQTGDAWASTLGPFENSALLLRGDYRNSVSDELAAEIHTRYSMIFTSHSIRYALHFIKCGRPLIHVNSTRFANEWTCHPVGLAEIIRDCEAVMELGQLQVIHNNLADKWYFEQFFRGIREFPCIPSLCEQALRFRIKQPKVGAKKPFVIWDTRFHAVDGGGSALFRALIESPAIRAVCDITSELAEENGGPLDDDMLEDYQAVIHVPYNISTMSCFEQAAANIPVWIPSRELLLECMGDVSGYSEMSWYCFGSKERRGEAPRPDRVWDPAVLAEFVDRSDYVGEVFKNLLVFESVKDLEERICSVDYAGITRDSFLWNCRRKLESAREFAKVIASSSP